MRWVCACVKWLKQKQNQLKSFFKPELLELHFNFMHETRINIRITEADTGKRVLDIWFWITFLHTHAHMTQSCGAIVRMHQCTFFPSSTSGKIASNTQPFVKSQPMPTSSTIDFNRTLLHNCPLVWTSKRQRNLQQRTLYPLGRGWYLWTARDVWRGGCRCRLNQHNRQHWPPGFPSPKRKCALYGTFYLRLLQPADIVVVLYLLRWAASVLHLHSAGPFY